MPPISAYRLQFSPLSSGPLPEWTGSMWRGAFGHALRDQQCTTRLSNCGSCELKHHCLYSTVFETPVPTDTTRMRKYTHAPHPYIIRTASHGAQQQLDLIIVGEHRHKARDLILAFAQASQGGLGKNHTKYKLDKVTDIQAELAPPALLDADTLDIELLSLCRINQHGRPMSVNNFDHRNWLRALLRRVNSLAHFHCPETVLSEQETNHTLDAIQRSTLVEHTLQWQKLERYSNRQTFCKQAPLYTTVNRR